MKNLKQKIYEFLRWSQKYTGTDNVYLVKEGFWLLMVQIFSIFTGLLLYMAFANFFSPHDYGIYKYVLSIVALLGIFNLEGINTSLIRSVAKGFEGSLTVALKEKIKWSALGSLILIGICGYYFLRENIMYAVLFLIAAFFFSFYSTFNIYVSFLNGKKEFKKRTIYFTFCQILYITGLVTALYLKANLIIIIFLYFFLQAVGNLLAYRKVYSQKRNEERDPEMSIYGKHLSLMGAMGTITANIDKLIIYHFLGPVELAIYTFALLPVDHIRTSFKIIKPLALPKFSKRSFEELKATVPKRTILLLGIIIVIILSYILIVPYFYKFLFPQYEESIFFSKVYIFSLLGILATVPGTVLVSQRQTKKLYILGAINSIMKITLLFTLTSVYGILGAITAIIIVGLFKTGLYHLGLK